MKEDKTQKVLIALDYDPTAQKVAEIGYSVALSMGAEIILLHVMSDPVYYSSREYDPIMGFTGYLSMEQVPSESAEGLKHASQQYLDHIKQYLGDESIKTLVKEGKIADSIIMAASALQADFIFLGSHSRRWLEEILMGSVTEYVLHHSSIPLFIIPTKKRS